MDRCAKIMLFASCKPAWVKRISESAFCVCAAVARLCDLKTVLVSCAVLWRYDCPQSTCKPHNNVSMCVCAVAYLFADRCIVINTKVDAIKKAAAALEAGAMAVLLEVPSGFLLLLLRCLASRFWGSK
jgi:hypothetical protein